ncbi:hypothetical protein [Micromonospora sp. NPDC049282]|uniref:hypothetical protein n=1 Tax=Micromonospora sp. NPDC049282 TaxID=3364269 RepID=UPI003718E495
MALTSAIDRLAASPGLHYKGRFDSPAGAADVDMRISHSGVALGSMSDSGTAFRILALPDRTFVRAGEAFWRSTTSAQTTSDPKPRAELVKRYSRSWVAVDARSIGDPGVTLRPAEVARQFSEQLRQTGVTRVDRGAVGEQQSTIITVGPTTYHVTADSPYRLLRVESPRIKAARAAMRGAVRGAALRTEQRLAPSDDGLDFGEMDPSELDGFYDTVETRRNANSARRSTHGWRSTPR